MKTKIVSIFLISISSFVFGQQTAKVVKVKDADTYNLLVDGKTITARLTNVDAPELKQAFGTSAKTEVEKLILNKEIRFESVGVDLYQRNLVHIWINGKALDSCLIANGCAWVYAQYCKDKMLIQLQNEAINAKIGLWTCGLTAVCPPWVYRKLNARNKIIYCTGCKN